MSRAHANNIHTQTKWHRHAHKQTGEKNPMNLCEAESKDFKSFSELGHSQTASKQALIELLQSILILVHFNLKHMTVPVWVAPGDSVPKPHECPCYELHHQLWREHQKVDYYYRCVCDSVAALIAWPVWEYQTAVSIIVAQWKNVVVQHTTPTLRCCSVTVLIVTLCQKVPYANHRNSGFVINIGKKKPYINLTLCLGSWSVPENVCNVWCISGIPILRLKKVP